MAETLPNLTVFIMGLDDLHIGLTGKDEAPIAIVIPKASMGLGLTRAVACLLHDNLCTALATLEDFSDEAKLELDFSELPKNKLN